mmetsp:Transcript_9688/g.10958  ORF Transcript_9688/g.10958 Transcript_9688/m.10958 type:complete len:86 (+) Transcript_9688:271-528(+)
MRKMEVLTFCRKVGSLAKTQMMNLFIVGMHKLEDQELKLVDSFLQYCISNTFLTLTFNFKNMVVDEMPKGMLSSMKYPSETLNIT